jgi:integrase
LRGKHVTMHSLRHTAAMRLLHAGTDIAVIALWLGHEQLATAPTELARPRAATIRGKPSGYAVTSRRRKMVPATAAAPSM